MGIVFYSILNLPDWFGLLMNKKLPEIDLLTSPDWQDYELLDSGDGLKLERFGAYTFIRPDAQAIWKPALPEKHWKAADGVFEATAEESGGRWQFKNRVEPRWEMTYKTLKFWAGASSSRHMGVFPEQATHWDWVSEKIRNARQSVKVLNLFGYTGIATLAAAAAGAKATHVDASKKVVAWARENQAFSGLAERPVRWIVDDALKFVEREARRGSFYDGLILDPPKFGRGPKGEVWEFYKLIPALMQACRKALSPSPLFIVLTAYAIRTSALSLYYAMEEMMADFKGELSCGELVTVEKSAGRAISHAIYARWSVG